ncbi:hypothetical protein ACIBKY_53125 [Nonomuraea sp. NPDC050394]|uniref:hypothetical protein n=1 Tax=Nonomuraea sp. NPDC050394 TaxID=3364363 RepID=UPI00379972D1
MASSGGVSDDIAALAFSGAGGVCVEVEPVEELLVEKMAGGAVQVAWVCSHYALAIGRIYVTE